MTLEAAIQENTGAIRALIAALAKGASTTSEPVAAVVPTPKAKNEKPPASLSPVDASTSVSPAPATAEETDGPTVASPAPGTTYDDVKRVIVKMSGLKGRDQVLAVLGQFGAARGPDLKPEQFADFIAQADAAMAG